MLWLTFHLDSIVNVMRSSGCEVPPFMLDLPAPSQRMKKIMSIKPLNRVDVRQTNGSGAVKVGGTRKTVRERVMGGVNSKKGPMDDDAAGTSDRSQVKGAGVKDSKGSGEKVKRRKVGGGAKNIVIDE